MDLDQSVAEQVDRLRLRGRVSRAGLRAGAITLTFNAMAGVAAAQSGAGEICGTGIADGATQTARLIVGLLILGCIVVAGIAHGYSTLKRDPNEVAELIDWRNRAASGVVGVPVVMWLLITIAGFFGIPIVSCVDLVPYF